MDSILSDIRYSLRMLLRMPGFTIVAVLTLTLGIGANSAIFSIVNTLLLKHLPVQDPTRLVRIHPGLSHASYLNYHDFRTFGRDQRLFTDIAGERLQELSLANGSDGQRVLGEMVTGNYFPLLGLQAQAGRTFAGEVDLETGAHNVAVISDSFWKRALGQGAGTLGSSITLNGQKFTIVGVMPPKFSGTFPFALVPDVYIPLSNYPTLIAGQQKTFDDRAHILVQMFGRLQPGVTMEQAQAAISTFAAQLEKQYPDQSKGVADSKLYSLDGLGAFLGMSFAPVVFGFLGLLTALVGIVLLIACANLANLLLARAWNRRKEVAIRSALGAGRMRLAQQFLTESVLLSIMGGLCACLAASWVMDLARTLRPPVPMPIAFDFGFDWRVLTFTAVLSVVTGLVFGMAPAWHLSRPDLNVLMKEGAHSFAGGQRRFSFRNLLVVGQVAASLVLLVCAGLFLRSLTNSKQMSPGFDPEHVVTAEINFQTAGYDLKQATLMYQDLLSRMRQTPGVQSASVASIVPLSMNVREMPIKTDKTPQGSPGISCMFNEIGSDYFRTMRIPLLTGREFLASDTDSAPRVAIVNKTFAQRAFGRQDVLGTQIASFDGPGKPPVWMEVIGVVADTKYRTPGEDPQPIIYMPLDQSYSSRMVFHARVTGDPHAFGGTIRQLISSADSRIVPQISTLRDETSLALIPTRIATFLLGVLGILGLLLASIGIYGVISYSASQRTHEVGVRMALGARPMDIFRLMVGDGLLLAGVGLAIGLLLAGVISRLLSGMLAGVSPLDPLTYAAVGMLLLMIASIATLVPALRSVKVDPMVALRVE